MTWVNSYCWLFHHGIPQGGGLVTLQSHPLTAQGPLGSLTKGLSPGHQGVVARESFLTRMLWGHHPWGVLHLQGGD